MEFYNNQRLGRRARIPQLKRAATQAAKTLYDSSFAVHGAKLWNLLPSHVNTTVELGDFKTSLGKFLDKIPDKPPVRGYTTINKNSLTDWYNQSGGLREMW